MQTYETGQPVRLKPHRADAYGVSRDRMFVILDIYNPHPQYKSLWAKLEGFGPVKLSELR